MARWATCGERMLALAIAWSLLESRTIPQPVAMIDGFTVFTLPGGGHRPGLLISGEAFPSFEMYYARGGASVAVYRRYEESVGGPLHLVVPWKWVLNRGWPVDPSRRL